MSSTMEAPLPHETCWRPVAYVAVRDVKQRSEISRALRRAGWAVVDSPSGYHLLQSISGPLFEGKPWMRPDLVVVDAFSPGCSGFTIARGLRDCGWSIPTVLILACEEHRKWVTEDPDNGIYVVDRDIATCAILAAFGKSQTPLPLSGKPWPTTTRHLN